MSDSLKIQGVVEVSTEGAESSLGRVGNAADKMAVNMTEAGAKAGKAVDQIGEIAKATGEKFTRAESAITGSFKKLAVEAAKGKSVLEGLGNIEFNIAAKGLDPAKFKEMGTVVRQLAAEYSHLETAQARTSGSSGQLASRLQNSSYQLQDFIVQVNGGVDATKALGQQLPQLLVGFGAAGAAIGVVAALLPNIIAAFSNSAEGAKKFSDALSDFDKAVGDVGSTVKSFDMEKLYEEFNNSSSAVRAATIEQIKFQQEYIKTTQLVAGKKFGESLGGMGEYSTLDKLAGSYGSSGAEKLAKQLGVTVEVAKDLLPVLGGLKSGSEDVGLAFSKFGTTLLSGNAKAVELAQTMATLSKSERDGAAASSALSEAQAKMAKGHIVTKKEAEAAAKATKASSKATEELANLLDKINGKESGLNAEYWNELERLNAAYKSGKIPLDAYSDLVDKLTKQQPFYVKGLKDEAEALKDITDLERERAKYALGISKQTQDLIEKADAAEYENSKIGATEQQLIALTAARYDEQIALKQEKIAAIEMMEGRNAEVEAIEQQISALRRLQSAEIAKPKLREQAREWEKFSDDINRALTDALMRGFESGKSFGENFVDSLKNSLKTAALKLVVNVVTSTGGSVVNAAINAVAGTGGANGGAGTNYMGLANNASSMYNMYGAASQLFTGASVGASTASLAYANGVGMIGGDSLGALYAANGGWAGVEAGGAAASAVGAEAGWSSMLGEAAAGAWVLAIPAIAGAISAAGSRKAYEFDGIAIKGDYAGSNFTGSAATKWEADGGWWESGDKMKKWMPLTGDRDAIIEAFFGGGLSRNGMTGYVTPSYGEYTRAADLADLGDLRDTPSIAGVDNSGLVAAWDAEYALWQRAHPVSFSSGFASGDGAEWTGGDRPEEVSAYMPSFMGAGFFGSVSKTPVLSTDPVMLAALDNAIDAIFKATQTSFKALANQFEDTDLAGKVDAFSTSINLDTKSGDIDKVLAALASDVNAKMAQAFLPSIETLRLPEEAWQAAFNRVMVEVAGTSRILDMMGVSIKETFGSDTNKAITAIDGLSKAFGGIDNLSTSFSAYYANFYSAEEQRAQAMEDMGKAFTSLNLTMPETRAGFKALVEAQDLTTTSGQATFKSLMDLQGGFANLVPAITDVSTAVTDAAEALVKDRAALIAARNEATEAASTSLSDMQAAFDDLQKSITQGTVNGNLGALAFSASEFDSIASFVSYIDEANVKLAEIAKSPFADELSNYTTQIKALAQSVQDQAADTLINSRMLVGDIAGAIAAEVSKTQIDQSTYMLSEQGGKPRRGDFATRSDFDAAFAKWTSPQFVASAYNMANEERSIKAALTIANQMSANALRIPNAGSVGSQSVGVSSEYRYKLMREIASEYGIGSQSVLEQTLASALESSVGKLLRSNYTATGPGIASVNAAVNNYNDASKTGYVDGKFLMGADAISFAEGMRSLDATLKAGKLSVVDYAKGVDFLTGTFGGAMGDINDARLAAGSMAGAMAAAGSASIVYYFDQIAQQVASLAKASEQAAEPISQAVLAIGRMNSASTVFGESASAVMNGYLGMMGAGQGVMADSGSSDAQQRDALAMYANGAYGQNAAMQEGSDYRNAVLVSTAASVVSQIMTTQSAAEAAKLLAEKASFAGASNTQLRDASLLMDGLAQFDAVSLENVFNRLANALSTSKITEGQYVDMVSQSIDTFRGLDEETEAVKTAMQRLAESMGGFADKLLIDQSRTTIGATQTLAEIERQYSVARDSAKTGDANSISNYQSLANALLDKAMYDTQADYNDAFGKVYGDAKSLESVGVNTVAQINGDNVVTELKKMNTELSDRVESLERNLTTALAVIAKNTAKTSSGIEQINTVGLPA